MPNSLKCKIKHLCHNGTITERERDRLLEALEQELVLNEIRAKIAAKIGGNGSENDGLDKALAIIDEYIREGKDCTDCILDGTDACPRGAGRAVDAEGCKYFIGESEEKNEEM